MELASHRCHALNDDSVRIILYADATLCTIMSSLRVEKVKRRPLIKLQKKVDHIGQQPTELVVNRVASLAAQTALT